VVAAAAAVAAGAVLGYWSGAGPGVLAALAGLIPAVVWQVAVNRQGTAGERSARLAGAEAAFAPRAAAIPVAEAGGAGGGVARYLRPEAEVIRFWPRPELDELLAWVVSEERVGVRLVTGAGGSGKTRLARQLGEQVTALGRRSWWVSAGQEADAVRVAGEGALSTLLIADYAETRTGSLPALLATAADMEGGPCLRVLLLARSTGEWLHPGLTMLA
jgi:hypothetical protein